MFFLLQPTTKKSVDALTHTPDTSSILFFLQSKMSSRQHVQAGACMDSSGTVVRCVLEKTSCPSNSVFYSSYEIHAENVNAAQACLSNESARGVLTGRCASDIDNRVCTSSASNCQFASTFQPDNMCTVLSDTRSTSAAAYAAYGSCYSPTTQKTLFCGWSSEDCPDSNQWMPANHKFTHARGVCTCDRVQTGQCVASDGTSYCAVSKNGCDDESSYTPASASSNCYLCDTVVDKESTALRPYQDALMNSQNHNSYNSTTTKQQNEAIIGIVVAMAFVAIVAGVVIHKVRRRRRRAGSKGGSTSSNNKSSTAGTNTDGTEVVEEMELELAVANKTID